MTRDERREGCWSLMRFWLEGTDWISILLLQRKDGTDRNQETCGKDFDKMLVVGEELEEGVAELKLEEITMK